MIVALERLAQTIDCLEMKRINQPNRISEQDKADEGSWVETIDKTFTENRSRSEIIVD
jgi:hypothetical protein